MVAFMKKLHQDIYVGIGSLLFCAFIFYANRSLPPESKAMPYAMAGLMAAFSVVILLSGIRKTKVSGASGNLTWDDVKIPVCLLGCIACYLLLFRLIGYLAATAIMLIVMLVFLKRRSKLEIACVVAGYTAFVYVLFVMILNVPIDNFGLLGYLLK